MPGLFDDYKYARMRNAPEHANPLSQAVIGPLEHREFVREYVGSGDSLAAPAMGAAIPAYTGGKYVDQKFRENGMLGNPLLYLMYKAAKQNKLLSSPRSPASWDEMFAGYEGLFSGLRDKYKPTPEKEAYADATGH